jgi:hypothetical protein
LGRARGVAQSAPARIRGRLVNPIEAALDATGRAENATGRARARLLRRASRSMTRLVRTLERGRVRRALPPEFVATLRDTAAAIADDLQTLRGSTERVLAEAQAGSVARRTTRSAARAWIAGSS